jgi:hypothetical protein
MAIYNYKEKKKHYKLKSLKGEVYISVVSETVRGRKLYGFF